MRVKKKGLTKEAIKEFNESRKGLEVDVMHSAIFTPHGVDSCCGRLRCGSCGNR